MLKGVSLFLVGLIFSIAFITLVIIFSPITVLAWLVCLSLVIGAMQQASMPLYDAFKKRSVEKKETKKK